MKNKLSACLFLVFFFLVEGELFPDGKNIFRELIDSYSGWKYIDADIVQYIKTPGSVRSVYRGRLRARKGGVFRIDYHFPEKQLVFCNSRGLSWYYPQDKLVYEINGNPVNTRGIAPLDEFKEKDRFKLESSSRKLYNLFTIAEHFTVKDTVNGFITELWIDPSERTILKKIVKNKNGYQVLKEVYSGFIKKGRFTLPSEVRVVVRTGEGRIENITLYKNIKINIIVPDEVFSPVLPAKIKRRRINEASFK